MNIDSDAINILNAINANITTDTTSTAEDYTITDSRNESPKLTIKDYKSTCISIFSGVFNKYKARTQKDKELQKMEEMAYQDYNAFLKLKFCFEMLIGFLKYAIIANYDNFELFLKRNSYPTIEELQELEFNIPKNIDELLYMYQEYPHLLEIPQLPDIMFELISNEKYPLLLKINNINQLFYFSIFPKIEDTKFINACIMDIEAFYALIKSLVKELLKMHIKLAQTLYKKA